LVALAPWIATVFLKSPELVNEIRLCSIAVLFMTMNGYQAGALQGMETFSALARIAVIMGPITIALTLALSWSFHLPGGAMATGIVAMLSWGLHQIMLRRETRRRNIRIRYDHLRRELPLLRGFALPAAISAIVGGIAITGASAAVARQPGGFAELAVFSAANTLRTIALFMPSLVSRVSMPVLCNLQATRDARYQRTLWTCLVFNAGLTAVSAVVLYSLAPLALWMFGRGFVASRTMPALLLASAVAETIAVGWYQVICSHGKMWTQLAICCLWSCVLLGGTMWSVETGGAAALAGAYLAAWTLAAALYAAASRRLLQNGSFSSPTCRN
jgi:O-antigen/teichoic acid export membrane protein